MTPLSIVTDGLVLDLTTGKIISSTIRTSMRILSNRRMYVNNLTLTGMLSKRYIVNKSTSKLQINQKFGVNLCP